MVYINKLPAKYHAKMLLLDVVIDDDDGQSIRQGRYSAERITTPKDVRQNLCRPINGREKRNWPIMYFITIEECCEAVLHMEELGYAWDDG